MPSFRLVAGPQVVATSPRPAGRGRCNSREHPRGSTRTVLPREPSTTAWGKNMLSGKCLVPSTSVPQGRPTRYRCLGRPADPRSDRTREEVGAGPCALGLRIGPASGPSEAEFPPLDLPLCVLVRASRSWLRAIFSVMWSFIKAATLSSSLASGIASSIPRARCVRHV